jgi:hypothetical protein
VAGGMASHVASAFRGLIAHHPGSLLRVAGGHVSDDFVLQICDAILTQRSTSSTESNL